MKVTQKRIEAIRKIAEACRDKKDPACALSAEEMLEWCRLAKIGLETEQFDAGMKKMTKAGTKAWADVPNASDFVEEIRGNTETCGMCHYHGANGYCPVVGENRKPGCKELCVMFKRRSGKRGA